MEQLRKPFQGVTNIIRFNWHFYVTALLIIAVTCITAFIFADYKILLIVIAIVIALPVVISLSVSFFVYDISGLYELKWLNGVNINTNTIVNINAGFDETSSLLQQKFKPVNFIVYDFYDEAKHTEVSIKRARRVYAAYPFAKQITTTRLPLHNNSINTIFLIFAAHEIRDDKERIVFFKELARILDDNGKIIITEHIRDVQNFLAYNIGFLHFLSYKTWLKTFNSAGINIANKIKITPFITTFILTKNGTAP